MFFPPLMLSLELVAVATLIASGNAQSQLSIAPPKEPSGNSNVSQYIPAEYAGFGIEPSNLFSFTGTNTTNAFTVQLMQNLATYSGKPVHVRVGGNTQDYFLYDASMTDYVVFNNPRPVGQGQIASDAMIVGPRFFEAIKRFPRGTPVTFGLNLAYYQADHLDRVVDMARAAVDALHSSDEIRLASFEIGNEPDLYLQNGFRNGSWGGQTYVSEWTARAAAVYERVLQPAGLPADFFDGPCAASTIGTSFEYATLMGNGIMQPQQQQQQQQQQSYIRAWDAHDYLYFVGVTPAVLTTAWLMDLDNTDAQFAYDASQVAVALATGLPYHLREFASVGPLGVAGVSDTFGAALFMLNFFLYAATLNVSSVLVHMTDNSLAAPWLPAAAGGGSGTVRPAYYAHAAMGQIIGSGNGTTQVARLDGNGVPEAYKSSVRAYALYGAGQLTGVVVVNARPVNASSSNSADKLAVTVDVPGGKGQTLHLSYMTAAGADSTTGTVWNGISYADGDGKPQEAQGEGLAESVEVGDDGKASFDLRDSQAVVAYVGSRLGSNKVETTSGSDGGSSTSTGSGAKGSDESGAQRVDAACRWLWMAVAVSWLVYSCC